MLYKRHIPLLIVVGVGLLTLFGHFINNDIVKDFVDNDSTQWFDIIASFAVFLGALNMLKLQIIKIINKKKNWQYSILSVLGFSFAILAGFFYKGANYVVITDIKLEDIRKVSEIIATETQHKNIYEIESKLIKLESPYEVDKIFITKRNANRFIDQIAPLVKKIELKSKPWGAHVQTEGSLFYWMFIYMITPLGATMFALLAFFVASASYRAFRIRNFEATLLLIAGILLMLGRVPIGALIPWWAISIAAIFGLGALLAPLIKDKKVLFGFVGIGSVLLILIGTYLGWNQNPPELLSIPAIQDWIFAYPTMAGSRALMIGIALGIVATCFRIIIGLDKSFLGE
tara:strand:+ start:302 stop:1333 length:1032 start_codon:yes stop_codon:yes gene_type:complete